MFLMPRRSNARIGLCATIFGSSSPGEICLQLFDRRRKELAEGVQSLRAGAAVIKDPEYAGYLYTPIGAFVQKLVQCLRVMLGSDLGQVEAGAIIGIEVNQTGKDEATQWVV